MAKVFYNLMEIDQENYIPCPPAPRKGYEQFFNGVVWVSINKDYYTLLPKKSFGKIIN
jgi:hypothetical protein